MYRVVRKSSRRKRPRVIIYGARPRPTSRILRRHLLGGQLERNTSYGTTPTVTNFGKSCATVNIPKPNVDYKKTGFWPYQVYGLKGWIRSDRSTLKTRMPAQTMMAQSRFFWHKSGLRHRPEPDRQAGRRFFHHHPVRQPGQQNPAGLAELDTGKSENIGPGWAA